MWEGYPYLPLRKDFPLAGKAVGFARCGIHQISPMEGGPFVTIAGGNDTIAREPRVRVPETDTVELNARLERAETTRKHTGKLRDRARLRRNNFMPTVQDIEFTICRARRRSGGKRRIFRVNAWC